MNRRRFLSLCAAFACAPRFAVAGEWHGRAMGAKVSVSLTGPRSAVDAALATIPAQLDALETQFSLYRPTSALVQLNTVGRLRPTPSFRRLLAKVDHAHGLTDGLFDPTVQPLWHALAQGGDIQMARDRIGWHRVRIGDEIWLGRGQQLTLNGIAQGFATDMIRAFLAEQGFSRALVNIGEHAAIGGPFRLGLADDGAVSLTDTALATSSPMALPLGAGGHILGPNGEAPLWRSVSVEAHSATLVDALSTAAVFMDSTRLRQLKDEAGLHRILCVGNDGSVRTI